MISGDSRASCPDALTAITDDLDSLCQERRRHFLPALVLAVTTVGLAFAFAGMRPDLWLQPPWQIAVQFAGWVLCLGLFPAIGVGIWFPGRRARQGLAVAGIALSLLAAFGIPHLTHHLDQTTPMAMGNRPCWMLLSGCGVVLLGLGALSGAFSQRRARSSIYWVATGLALASLHVLTWVCASQDWSHLVSRHLLPAGGVVVLAVVLGSFIQRGRAWRGRQRTG